MKCDRVWLGHCSLRDHPLEFGHLTCSFHRQIIFHNYGLDCVVAAAGVNRTITCLNRCSQTAACAQSFCKLLVGGWMSVSKIRPAARAQHNLNSTKLDFHCPRATSPSPFAEALASSIYVRGRNTYALSPLIRQLMSVATSNLYVHCPPDEAYSYIPFTALSHHLFLQRYHCSANETNNTLHDECVPGVAPWHYGSYKYHGTS